jgi:hypothetical protein
VVTYYEPQYHGQRGIMSIAENATGRMHSPLTHQSSEFDLLAKEV